MRNKSIEELVKTHKEFLAMYEQQADLHRNSINALEGLLRHANSDEALSKAIAECDNALCDAPVATAWHADFKGVDQVGTITIGDNKVAAYMSGIHGVKISSSPSCIKKRYNVWIIET